MKNKKYFTYAAVIAAAMSTLTACSNEEEAIFEETQEIALPEVKGHPLTITAGITSGTNKRLVGQEVENGLKFNWEVADKLYMLTSKDGETWDNTFYTFSAKEINAENAAKATFVCDNFTFTEGTTLVKFIYMPGNITTVEDLEKGAQQLGVQDGTIAGVTGKLRMESPVLPVANEEDVKNLALSLAHSNSVMKVTIAKSDIEWGENFAPTEITMKLESSTILLNGTTDNTININNPSAAWDDNEQTTANVVVCMDGAVSENDRWIFTAKDALGNTLVKTTKSAKMLASGKRYNAPVTFTTEDYFPFITGYFNPSIWDTGSFDEAQKAFTTAAYGFSGWSTELGYPTTWNLSNYKYLVIELANGSVMNASFRMFDEANYWGKQSRLLCDKSVNVIDLSQPIDKWVNDDTTEGTLDISNVAIAGFWSFGDGAIIINKMYLTNTAPGTPSGDGNTEVDVPGIDDSDESAW